tara:strand:- start:391 stop:1218 length:828 start_codon:yes stop_codon:yes gene_type:complete
VSSSIFKKSVSNFYLLLLLIGLSISSIVLDLKYSNSNYIRIIINDFLITPIQYLASTPSTFFTKFVEEKRTIEELQLQIEDLQKQNTAMKINLQRIDVLENEVSRLRSIKKKADVSLKNIKIAQITQMDVIPNKKSVQINIGSDYNTQIGQTVMGVKGLLGQVVEVNVYTSKVLLITDTDSNVPAKIARTGQQVIIKGRSQDDMLEIPFLPNDSEIESGDLLVTSGQAKRFIPSLKIGRVVEVIRNEGERFSEVVIQPLEEINNISEVILSSEEE